MLIGKRGYYYLKAMLFFAFSKKESFSIREIAKRLGISEKVMEQVLLSLKNAGFLISKRGPRGGYQLGETAADLTVMDLLERTNQKIIVLPVEASKKRNLIDNVLAEAGEDIERKIFENLKKITIKDLKDRMNEKVTETGFNYVI